jgi:hypothetical protein
MAVLEGAYAANKVTPPPTLTDFNKFDKHATQKFPLGHKVECADGSIYRYSHFGADTDRGVLVSTDMSETCVADTDNAIIASASSVNTSDSLIGSRFIQMTLASTTANQFVGGKLITTDDAGEGYTYDIKGNTATGDPSSGTIRIELHQPLQVAVTTATDVAIIGSLYHDLEVATTTDDAVVGVSCSSMDVSEQPFGWIQTKGVVGVLQDVNVPVVGAVATLSNLTSGAVTIMGGNSTYATYYGLNPIVGIFLDVGDSTGHAAIKLNLE